MPRVTEKIIPIDYTDEMKKSYIDYAMSVIISRAIPDVRDGLKPVHRRVLYSMKELGLLPVYNESKKKFEVKPFKKSARIVGDTMGKYHPHGDSSIYEALVIMAQDFKMGKTLVDGEGNFGSIDGDSPAQMRYTEARLSDAMHYLLSDMDKDTVDFMDNFDGTQKQPVVLPAKYPNILVNGAEGIAVGMTTKIPPHNLNEVIDGVIELIENPKATTDDLMKHIKGPDFPTGGIITNRDDLKELYETGQKKITIRSKITTEQGQSGRINLVITEVPYTFAGGVGRLIEDIANQAKTGKMPELYDIKNQSSMEGVKIVLEVKKGVDIENFKTKLYKKTGLESSFPATLRAIVNGRPKLLSLKRILEEFINFQIEVYTRKYQFLLDRATKRMEVVSGLLRAIDVIDVIIEVIRGSKNKQAIKNCMMYGDLAEVTLKTKKYNAIAKTFNFTETQTDAILNIQLIGLMGLEVNRLTDESKVLEKNISEYEKYLRSKKSLNALIKKEIMQVKEILGEKRRSEITQLVTENYVEVVEIEELYLLIDKFNYAKVIDSASFARVNPATLDEYKQVIKANSNERVIALSANGESYVLKISEVKKGKMSDRGTPISVLLDTAEDEILSINLLETLVSQDGKFLFVTQFGESKLVSVSEYDTNYKKILAIKLDAGDKLIYADKYDEQSYIAFVSQSDKVAKMSASELVSKKRANKGAKTVELGSGDKLVSCFVLGEKPHLIEIKGNAVNIDRVNAKKRIVKLNPLKK